MLWAQKTLQNPQWGGHQTYCHHEQSSPGGGTGGGVGGGHGPSAHLDPEDLARILLPCPLRPLLVWLEEAQLTPSNLLTRLAEAADDDLSSWREALRRIPERWRC